MTFRFAQVQRSEHEEQAAIFRWAEIMAKRAPELDLLFCIPNGGHRDIRVAARLKKEGVRAGVPTCVSPSRATGSRRSTSS